MSIANSNLVPDLIPLRNAIYAWMKLWNLDAPWIGDVALKTLREWEMVPSLRERLEWSPCSSGWMEPDPIFGPAPWTPHGDESSKDARGRLDTFYEEQKKILARQEKAARSQGLPVEPGRHQSQTIGWAVRFQILGEPASKIADDERKDVKTVRAAIYGFLEFIDLPRRNATGRPKGGRNQAGTAKRAGSTKQAGIVEPFLDTF